MVFRAMAWATVMALGLATMPTVGQAQGARPKINGANPAAEPEVKLDSKTDWAPMHAKFKKNREKLEQMQKEFETADAKKQLEIQQQAGGLIQEINAVYPALRQMAPEVFKADPTNVDAAEICLEIDFQKNRYADAVKAADLILTRDPTNQLALNLGAVSHFATHDFAGAKALFEKAQAANVLIGQLAQYAENCEPYAAYWAKEANIREKEDAAQGDEQLPIAEFETTKGKVAFLLLENEAPNTVANFVSLVEKKYYDGLQFHRVIPQFMAQGGCPNSRPGSTEPPGTGGPGYNIKCECYQPNARMHFMGSLSMAHAGKDTGGSQFFITHLPTAHLNPNPAAQRGHTVFGRVIEGQDVVASIEKGDTITSAKVVRKRNHEYKPETQPER